MRGGGFPGHALKGLVSQDLDDLGMTNSWCINSATLCLKKFLHGTYNCELLERAKVKLSSSVHIFIHFFTYAIRTLIIIMSQAKLGIFGDYSTYDCSPMNLSIDIDGHRRLSISRQKLPCQLVTVEYSNRQVMSYHSWENGMAFSGSTSTFWPLKRKLYLKSVVSVDFH